MNRRFLRWFLPALGAAGGLLYAHFIERSHVRLDRFTIEVDRAGLRPDGLPPDGIVILHLSDLHCRAAERVQAIKLARLRRLLAAEQYDLLAFTGDLIHDMTGLPKALAFLGELHPGLGAFSVPGNRDYWVSGFRALWGGGEERAGRSVWLQLKGTVRRVRSYFHRLSRNQFSGLQLHRNDISAMHAALADMGVQPLVNQARHVQQAGVDLWVAGVDDLYCGHADLAAALAGVPAGALLILLAHNPDVWLDARAQRADLILAGHTHGGQLRLPGLGALYRQGTHLGRRRAAGWFRQGETRLFVSRGLGESFPLRFGAPLQAVLIRVLPGDRSCQR